MYEELNEEYYLLLSEVADLLITKDPAGARDMLMDYIDEHWGANEALRAKKYLLKLPLPNEGIRYEKRT